MYLGRLYAIHNRSAPVFHNISAIVDIFVEMGEFAADAGACVVDATEWLAVFWSAQEEAVAIQFYSPAAVVKQSVGVFFGAHAGVEENP